MLGMYILGGAILLGCLLAVFYQLRARPKVALDGGYLDPAAVPPLGLVPITARSVSISGTAPRHHDDWAGGSPAVSVTRGAANEELGGFGARSTLAGFAPPVPTEASRLQALPWIKTRAETADFAEAQPPPPLLPSTPPLPWLDLTGRRGLESPALVGASPADPHHVEPLGAYYGATAMSFANPGHISSVGHDGYQV